MPPDAVSGITVLGELGLDGSIAAVAGVLPAAIGANARGEGLICPAACGPEAAWASPEMEIIAAQSLIQLANHFRGTQVLARPQPKIREVDSALVDLKDIKGQESAKRALEIAAAGGHHLLMIGSPGAGKSMLAARLPSILPPLSPPELLEVSMIASVAGQIEGGALTSRRPFRSPHHSASMAALTGGGVRAKPGEISLAHQGVLFLDELPEFDPRVLDSLRQPIENGEVAVSRANHRVTYPARFMLVAAMNPCRCGRAFEPGYACKRGRIDRCTGDYQMRISGPLMDRIDLRIEVPAVTAADLILPPPSEGSAEVAARVAAARDTQLTRYASAGLPHIRTNAEAPSSVLDEIAQPDAQGQKLLRDAAETMRLSARGYHRVLRVARTLADLDRADKIGRLHLAEALSYRALADDVRHAA
jgi:magnesium chelatase family protein